ncbi:MAG: transposase [Candidatus Petromonas sp.]|jgi:hypothetical protein|nr:transposase [Candidatus Petromonas sp.]
MGTSKQFHIQGKKGSRFRDQLRGIDLEQVLIVAIDAAKLHQKAMICNFFYPGQKAGNQKTLFPPNGN